MRGPHGIDVASLHFHHVAYHIAGADAATAFHVELVSVDAVKHDSLSVEQQKAVLEAKSPETGAECGGFDYPVLRVGEYDEHRVERGNFGGPGAYCGKVEVETYRLEFALSVPGTRNLPGR